MCFATVLQVCTDPRFGRLEENFGEDAFVVASFGVAEMLGIQGRDSEKGPNGYLKDPKVNAWCQAKHFAGYGVICAPVHTPTQKK